MGKVKTYKNLFPKAYLPTYLPTYFFTLTYLLIYLPSLWTCGLMNVLFQVERSDYGS